MRGLAAVALVSTLILPVGGSAQEPQSSKRGDRLFLSIGPGWSSGAVRLTGVQLRADYSLTPLERVVGVRLHLGAFWTPTQSFSVPSILYGEGSRFVGASQAVRLDIGVTGSITPWPRARLSPYVVGGVAATQRWGSGRGSYVRPDGTPAGFSPQLGGTFGQFALVVGYGLRFRVGGHLWQLEARTFPGIHSTLGLGTTLHF